MKVCFPHPPGAGGPGSFQTRFEGELKKRGYTICYEKDSIKPDLIFIVGGTKRLFWLWKMKLKGIPIIYRLDGINWLHKKKKVGFKNYFLSESRNWISKFIHGFLADTIIYQSKFVEDWWIRSGWIKRESTFIIYNGVDIPNKQKTASLSPKKKRLVILEGTIDYSPYAVELINELAQELPDDIRIELYGKFEITSNKDRINKSVSFNGFLKREDVYDVLQGAVYLSMDINPACPNTVIEAMACGAPVVAFDTGSLTELVNKGAGEIVFYGADPWSLTHPDSDELMNRIEIIFDHYSEYSASAKQLAKEKFSIKGMTESYLAVMQKFE